MANQKPTPFETYFIPLQNDLIKHLDLYRTKENVGARYNRKRFAPTPNSEDNLLYLEAKEVRRRFEHLQEISNHKLSFVPRHP